MKRKLFVLLFIIFGSLSFAKELKFMGMQFGTSAEEVIKTMKKNGWAVSYDKIRDFQIRNIRFVKDNGTYANMPCNEIFIDFFKYAKTGIHELASVRVILTISKTDNSLRELLLAFDSMGLKIKEDNNPDLVTLYNDNYIVTFSPAYDSNIYLDISTVEFNELNDAIINAINILNKIHVNRYMQDSL